MTKNPSTEVSTLLGGSSATVGQVLSANAGPALNDQLTTIASQLQTLQTINQSQIASIEANTNAVSANTSNKGSAGSAAASVGNTLLNVLGIGSGISPLISGLVSLFGGGGSSQSTAMTPYIQPLAVDLQGGFGGSTAGGASGVEYGLGNVPRQVTAAAAQQQITVQVMAMDSQSFLDRSNDIAAAVRKAMLETSTLSDMIREV